MFRNSFYILAIMFLLCGCATRALPPQQLAVPIVVEQGNVRYSLFCEKKGYPGRFFVLPILEKQKLEQDISRLYFKVEIRKMGMEKLIVKGFLYSQGISGQKIIGDFSGFEKSLISVEVDLPTRDILNREIVSWFVIEDEGGLIFRSKKIHYIITTGGM